MQSGAGGGRESSAGGGRESYIGEGYSERQDERSDEDEDEGGGGGLNTETLSRLGAVETLLNQLLDRQVWCSCPLCRIDRTGVSFGWRHIDLPTCISPGSQHTVCPLHAA